MAAATPKKLVHWALDASLSDLASPFSEGTSSSSCSSTSSLQYINSQLAAHGYVYDQALSFDGLSKGDADRVAKCLLSMLSQRIDDMSRTEDLTSKLRTLSYDHQRVTSMYKSESEKAANAEREMNLHKSRMTAATKSLQSSENAHKHTTAELQRTRSTLHALRATHQTEIKKLEKEKERMVDRWSKLSDSQLKVGSLPAGMTCANHNVVEASDVQLRGKTQGFLDVSLEQTEAARKELFEQNRKLRSLLLSTANELQTLLHSVRTSDDSEQQSSEPVALTLSTLFPNPAVEASTETFTSLFSCLRECVSRTVEHNSTPCSTCSRNKQPSPPSTKSSTHDPTELDRMQAVIDKLRVELDNAQKQAAAAATQTQQLFDQFAEDQRIAQDGANEMSVDLITAPARDEEKNRLDVRFKELEDERRKFTEAAVRLGKEKAALEAERLRFLEERRSWEVEIMLAELPPTPAPVTDAPAPGRMPPTSTTAIPPLALPRNSPRKSKSPKKFKVKSASPRKTRVSRRSSGLGAIVLSPERKRKVVPAYETEVIPSAISIPPSPVRPAPDFKTSMVAPSPPPSAFLTSAFILPPPSPAASLPGRPGGGTALPPIPPLPKFEIPPPSEDIDTNDDSMDTTPEPIASSSTSSSSRSQAGPSIPVVPKTPVARPFPMAKPFAQRMIHAYSPAKPSPLSRILSLADSPESPDGVRLDALPELDESAIDAAPSVPPAQQQLPPPLRSLAEELGVSEDDESPPRGKQKQPAVAGAGAGPVKQGVNGDGGSKGKGKARVGPTSGPSAQGQRTSRARAGGTLEKENVKRAKLAGPSSESGTGSASAEQGGSARASSRESKSQKAAPGKPSSVRTRTGPAGGSDTKPGPELKPAAKKGGARRVPIGSAEAAFVPSWRG